MYPLNDSERDPNLVARETSLQRVHTVDSAYEAIKNSLRITEMALNPTSASYYHEQPSVPLESTTDYSNSEVTAHKHLHLVESVANNELLTDAYRQLDDLDHNTATQETSDVEKAA